MGDSVMTPTSRLVTVALAIGGLGGVGCKGRVEPQQSETPTLNVTHWTERTELYMEYPPLVAGHTALFAVHLTQLGDFKPVAAGQARVEFMPEASGRPTILAGPQPSRPGAFRVEGAAPAAGRYRWALVLDFPSLSDRHDLGDVQVFGDEQAARADASKRP